MFRDQTDIRAHSEGTNIYEGEIMYLVWCSVRSKYFLYLSLELCEVDIFILTSQIKLLMPREVK